MNWPGRILVYGCESCGGVGTAPGLIHEEGCVPLRGSFSPQCRYDDETVERARHLRARTKMSIAEIAVAVGASETTTHYWLSRERRVINTEGWTEELVVLAMKLFGEEEGRRPAFRDFRNDPRLPSVFPLERIFGKRNTIRKALAAAGFEIEAGSGVGFSDDEFRAMIVAFAADKRRLPKWSDWKKRHGLPCTNALYRRFGTASLSAVLEALDLDGKVLVGG